MSLRSMGRWAAAFAGRGLKKLAAAAALGVAAFGFADQAAAGVTFTGQFGDGGTWNVYEAVLTPFTYADAWEFAMTRSDPTGGSAVGHLFTIGSVEENNAVHAAGGGGDRWIGLSDRFGVAPGATESQFQFDPLAEGWAWVTGEPFTFLNWGAGEPNNAGTGEDAVHLRGDGLWNDHQSGFGLNEPGGPDPVLGDEPAEGQQAFGFIIEWDTELATEPMGFPMTRPDPALPRIFPEPLARLPGPDGTASAWGSRDVTGFTSGSGGTRVAVDRALSGMGTPVDGTLSMFAIRDPETNGTTPVAGAAAVPFVSNTAADDNNFVTIVKGTIEVPAGQGGEYTFQVRSDDGFAVRIISQASGGSLVQHPFTAARTGVTDEDGTLAFLPPTGDSNTLGVVNLAPGTYDVEFLMFEDGGGAFGEVSTAKGNFISPEPGSSPQWVLLGDGSTRPQIGPFPQAAKLTGNVNVRNYDRGAQTVISDVVANVRSGAIPTAEGNFDDAILYDGDDICCGRPGATLPASQINEFPNLGNDQFTTAMTGQFQVLDTDGAAGETLTFGLFADDNAGLHIIGQSFTGVNDFTGDGVAALVNPEGMADQWLVADYRTGNTNAFGLITLAEGTYDFEAFQLEEGGDSGLEIFVAAGDYLSTGLASGAFLPLTAETLPDAFLAANQGLALIDGPGTGPDEMGPLPGDFSGNNSVENADLTLLLDNWGQAVPPVPAGWDGAQPTAPAIDNDELTALLDNWGASQASGLAAGVPEPTSALMAAAGMLFAALVVRKRG